ncbi:MAG: phosphorylase family protein [Dermatophilaceae bacterium]
MTKRSAEDPWLDGRPPHVPARLGELPPVCLLPGDPARVTIAGEVLKDFVELGNNREFRLGVGEFEGERVAICSTGIGGPSTEIAVVELRRLGVSTFIRVGGMGAVSAKLAPGTLTRVSTALREGGAAKFYADDQDAINSSAEVNLALDEAATRYGETLEPISVLSCDSYYLGEGRPLAGMEAAASKRLKHVQGTGVDAMDMECETVFAVARALGGRFGAVLATRGNRLNDDWLEDYEPTQRKMLQIAASAASRLTQVS